MRVSLRVFLAASVALIAAAAGGASFDAWQRNAIFQPSAVTTYADQTVPTDFEAFDLKHPNGDTVRAWYMPARVGHAPTVLFFHGARRNLPGWASRMEHWQSLGFNVLAIDYRGFGQSTTLVPSEDTALADASLAVEELKRREPDERKRFLYGFSLGGAMAIAMAAEHDGVAGVVVESSFTSIGDLVRQSKWGWVPGLALLVTQRFDSADRIRNVNAPLLFIHGTDDGVVPHTMSDQLLADAVKVPAKYKHVLKFEGGHSSVIARGGREYDRALRSFTRAASQAVIVGAGVSAVVR